MSTTPPTEPTPVAPPAAPVAPQYGPPPSFPGAAAWGQGGAMPARPTKHHTGMVVGITLLALAVIGGGFAVINSTRSKPATPGTPNVPVTGPTVNPGLGPTPQPPQTPVTTPGPSLPPTVTTTLPPPVTQPPPTTPPTTPPSGGGGTQVVLGNITVAIPNGWSVMGGTADGQVVLNNTDGTAEFEIIAFQGKQGDDASTVMNTYMQQILASEVDQIKVDNQGAAQLPSSKVVSAQQLSYEAVLAGQQGSIPVEGVVFTFVTQDGIDLILDTFNAQGQFDQFKNDYSTMANSVVASL